MPDERHALAVKQAFEELDYALTTMRAVIPELTAIPDTFTVDLDKYIHGAAVSDNLLYGNISNYLHVVHACEEAPPEWWLTDLGLIFSRSLVALGDEYDIQWSRQYAADVLGVSVSAIGQAVSGGTYLRKPEYGFGVHRVDVLARLVHLEQRHKARRETAEEKIDRLERQLAKLRKEVGRV